MLNYIKTNDEGNYLDCNFISYNKHFANELNLLVNFKTLHPFPHKKNGP